VISFGGDGDSRLMKAMRVSLSTSLLTPDHDPLQLNYSSCASIPKSRNNWFCITLKTVIFVQDTIHLAVKLKSRLLNPTVNVVLKMGPTSISLATLHGKEEHFYGKKIIYKP